MNQMRRNLLYRLFAPKACDQKIDLCEGCAWKELKRHQKCSCCRRNQNMKDNYEPILRGGAGGGSENE